MVRKYMIMAAAVLWGVSSMEIAVRAEEPEQIVMMYLVEGNIPEDIERVEAAVNDLSISKINVSVEFKVANIESANANYSSWLASGENIDLMAIAFTDLSDYVNKKELMPLDHYMEYASDIKALTEEFPITEGAVFDGHIYGIAPVRQAYGSQSGYIIRSDLLEEIQWDKKDRYSLDDLTDIFWRIKEKYPSIYPCGVNVQDILSGSSIFLFTHEIDTLGATVCSGVLMDVEETKITNMFDTQEYYEYLQTVHLWYENGYIPEYASTMDIDKETLIKENIIAGYFMNISPAQLSSPSDRYNMGFLALPLTRPYRASVASVSNTYWAVPASSQKADAAMKFLDLMYSDDELPILFRYGIEGEHYQYDHQQGLFTVIDPAKYGAGVLNMFGDMRKLLHDLTELRACEEYTQQCEQHVSVATGYIYDGSQMKQELRNIQKVLDRYLPVLETGCAGNVDLTYKVFLKELKEAGIDRVIDDNQKQFDLWRQENR